jgi:hypothetical protein
MPVDFLGRFIPYLTAFIFAFRFRLRDFIEVGKAAAES